MTSETSSTKDVPQSPIEIKSSDGEVVLRQFTVKDSQEIFELIDRNRTHLSQFGDDTAGKYPTLETVQESIEHPKNPKRLRFAIRNRQGQFAGSINITPDEKKPETAEIGYYLGSEFQKKGHAGRAVEILTAYGFDILDYKTIYGDVAQGNTASINVLLRAGFKETARHGEKIRFSKQE